MYAYVDETGNTGNRIFDPEQPVFMTAAMITRSNFDMARRGDILALAKKIGVGALHANELGMGRVEVIAPRLLSALKKAEARFFVSRLEKRYLAAAKVFDTYFDQGENLAVPWNVYWIRSMRLTMMFKLATFVITEEAAQVVWDCVVAPKEARSKELFIKGAELLLAEVNNLPDKRARKIATDALQWALENPENFTTHIRERKRRNMHSPNFVAFNNLMMGIDRASQDMGLKIREIVHDRQQEFEKTFLDWHSLFSRPELENVEPLEWPGEAQPHKVGSVLGSSLRLSTEEDSVGLQAIDIVLWLYKRAVTGSDIGPEGARLMNHVFKRGYQNDFSFDGVGAIADQQLSTMMSADLSSEQLAAGKKLMEEMEARRIADMREYVQKKAS